MPPLRSPARLTVPVPLRCGRLDLPHRPVTKVPRLAKELRVPTPADRSPGQPWRPGTPPPAPIPPDTPSADIRVGYARYSHLTQELQSQLDALEAHGIPREKIFAEKVSTRVRVRPKFEAALDAARQIKAHAPHCRVILTVYEMKRLGRDSAELTALADHLTAHGTPWKCSPGPSPGSTNVAALLPVLQTYMGHSSIADTAYYLNLTAESYPDITARVRQAIGDVIPPGTTEEQGHDH